MKKFVLSLAVSAVLVGVVVPAQAQEGEESNPAIVHRHGIYTIVGGHMKAIKSILLLGFDAPKDVTFHAQGIADAFSHMGNSYPPGSDKGETKAKPEIWTQGEKVKQLGGNAFAAANDLAKVSQGGDKQASLVAFKKLGETCKACHDEFKKK
ncbi:MAG: cytochrome c [Magnetococcales bacterium]|nr:cytochrome c [Magnetococcales bacterium]